jgi:mono/diheme cytochrome c family protein
MLFLTERPHGAGDEKKESRMTQLKVIVAVIGGSALAGMMLLSPGTTQAEQKVDFVKDIKPIFAQSCVKCHGADPDGKKPKGKYDMTTREKAFKGGETPNAIVPGKASESLNYKLLLGPVGTGDDEIGRMPYKKDPLPQKEIDLIKQWIDQGAEWPAGVKVELAK